MAVSQVFVTIHSRHDLNDEVHLTFRLAIIRRQSGQIIGANERCARLRDFCTLILFIAVHMIDKEVFGAFLNAWKTT
jgi:hypothetical protein